jgi:hypothetical protein
MTDEILLLNGMPVRVPPNYRAHMERFRDAAGNPLTLSDVLKYGPRGSYHQEKADGQ